MVDVVDEATRSRMMSGIRAKNTKPEVIIRKGLHALGFRFRLHVPDIPGKPDLVFPKYRALVIVHGCFWHGHNCRYFKQPGTNTSFWMQKIEQNRQRDKRDLALQLNSGWRCLVVWECAIRASKSGGNLDVVSLVAKWLAGTAVTGTIDEQGLTIRVNHSSQGEKHPKSG